MSTDEFNSLTNFWINYDQNGNVVSVSDYFLDKVQIGGRILESFKFKRLYISKEDESKISEKLAGKVFEALCSFNSMSFRFTSHKISGENLLTGWPSSKN